MLFGDSPRDITVRLWLRKLLLARLFMPAFTKYAAIAPQLVQCDANFQILNFSGIVPWKVIHINQISALIVVLKTNDRDTRLYRTVHAIIGMH